MVWTTVAHLPATLPLLRLAVLRGDDDVRPIEQLLGLQEVEAMLFNVA
jgi:hypothetical protein